VFQLRGVLGIGARGRHAALRPGTGEAGLLDGTVRPPTADTMHPARAGEAEVTPSQAEA